MEKLSFFHCFYSFAFTSLLLLCQYFDVFLLFGANNLVWYFTNQLFSVFWTFTKKVQRPNEGNQIKNYNSKRKKKQWINTIDLVVSILYESI